MSFEDSSPQTAYTSRAEFLNLFIERFNLNDVKQISFLLSIRFDELEGGTLSTKVQALIDVIEREDRFLQLIEILSQMRPSVSWPTKPLEPYLKSNSSASFKHGENHNIIAENSPGAVLISGNVHGDVTIGDIHIQMTKPEPSIQEPPKSVPMPKPFGFVGRTAEIEKYKIQLKEQGFTVLTGMAGVGKTSLAIELAQHQHTMDAIFWYPFHAYEGVGSFIRSLAGFLAQQGHLGLWQTLERTRLSGGKQTEPRLLFGYLLELLKKGHFLLVLDDFQFLDDDPDLIDFLARLCLQRDAPQTQIIITSRRVPKFLRRSQIDELEGLSRLDCKQLLIENGLTLEEPFFESLFLNTGGNAQFLTLAIDSLKSATNVSEIIDRIAVSEDIEQFLLDEVAERLETKEARVMEAVSLLLGYPGTRDALEHLLNLDRLKNTLTDLTKRHLLKATDSEFGQAYTQHSIVQGFFYDQIGRRQKRQMHQLAGEYYQTEEVEHLTAIRHYQRAGNWEQAATLIVEHLWDMINRGQAKALLKHIELTPKKVSESNIELNLAWGQLLILLGDRETAKTRYEHALELLGKTSSSNLLTTTYRLMGELWEQTAPPSARDWLLRGLEIVDKDPLLQQNERTKMLALLGTVEMHLGNYDVALSYLKQAKSLLPTEYTPQHANIYKNMGGVQYLLGQYDQATSFIEQALEVSQSFQDDFQTANIYINSGANKFVTGDWGGGIGDLEMGLELATKIGNKKGQSSILVNLGACYISQGEYLLAQEKLKKGIALASENQQHHVHINGLLWLADLWTRSENLLEAEELLIESVALSNQFEIEHTLISAYTIWGENKLSQGDLEEARSLIEKSLTITKEQNRSYEEGLNLRVFGQILSKLGDLKQAQTQFAQSVILLEADDPYETMRTKMRWGFAIFDETPEMAKSLLMEAQQVFEALGAKAELQLIDGIFERSAD